MTAIEYRPARADDVVAIVALVECAYRGDASRRGWTTEADLLDGQRTDAASVAALITAPHSMLLLAHANGDGMLAACCHLAREGADNAYFGMFAVRPELQNAGLGRGMLDAAERIALSTWACTTMAMTVIDVRAELIAWYERRGYRRTGIHRPFPYGDARFGVPRRGDLRFELLIKPLRGAGP
jgi:ribosomal protein S18 acetylase RimI-like enzyme